MLDRGLHQGMGLLKRQPASGLRFAAVAQAPDANALHTLWLLCQQLQQLGYPTLVLDGCAAESEHSPGLAQLLQAGALPVAPQWGDGASVAVLPAAHGLRQLPLDASVPLAPLQPLLRSYALVLLHAPVPQLSALLQPHSIVPLILAAPGTAGTQQAYRHIKHLHLHAALPSLVCALAGNDSPAQERQARTQITTLQRCAADYLGLTQRGLVLHTQNPQDLQRLALQLLENASTITEAAPPLPPYYPRQAAAAAAFVRSH